MNTSRVILIIVVCGLCTFLERALPFLLFRGKLIPPVIKYLGKVLPMAIMTTLIIYGLRGINLELRSSWLPQIAASIVTVILHLWKRNSMLSIFGGTLCCMILVHVL